MYDRATLKARARACLTENWGTAIGVSVLYAVLIAAATGITLGLGAFFLAPPLLVGMTTFFLGMWRRQGPGFESLFAGFNRYTQSLIGVLWMQLWTFLWSLLFIIPGIIKGLSYSLTPYLISDYPELSPQRALKVSMAVTEGHLGEIFMLHISFIGWHLLSAFTFGILEIVYVTPYLETAKAGLYESLMQEAFEAGIVRTEDLVY